jgi:hypothetical protein
MKHQTQSTIALNLNDRPYLYQIDYEHELNVIN